MTRSSPNSGASVWCLALAPSPTILPILQVTSIDAKLEAMTSVLQSLDERLTSAARRKAPREARSVGHQHTIRTHDRTPHIKRSSSTLAERADGQVKLMAESTDDDELDLLPRLVTAESSTGSPSHTVGAKGIKRYRRRRRVPKDSPPTVGSPKPASSPYAENGPDCSQLDLETIELDALGA